MEQYEYLSKIYDVMMQDVDYKKWALYLDALLKKNGAKRVFEVSCGTGNITFELYKLGFDITASDISVSMLSAAKRKSEELCADIKFIRQDMRKIETAGKTDAVVSACDGLNYIDANGMKDFFKGAYRALKQGGLLLFDISSAFKLRNVLDGNVYFDESDDAACIWKNSFDKDKKELKMDVTVFYRNGELFERRHEMHVQYAHIEDDIISAAVGAGFSKVEVYDCFTFDKPKQNSQRLQFAALKI